jgi:nitrate reductase alpha subunit
VRDDPGAVGTNETDALPAEGFRALARRTGQHLVTSRAEHEGKRIRFADTQARPVPVITSPEWSGSETGGAVFAVHHQRRRLKPWHT